MTFSSDPPSRDQGTGGAGRRRGRAKGPRKATPDYLEKAALHYLERYASSTANLRQVLLRKVERSARAHGTDRAEGAQAVEALLARLGDAGYLDDAAYARGRAVGLHRAGHSVRAIQARLRQKGVADDTVRQALEQLHDEADAPELAAALRYARKRRLGPYRPEADREANAERDMAALARKGFSLDLARRVVLCADPEDLEREAGQQPGPLG
jgi:regulatory protein